MVETAFAAARHWLLGGNTVVRADLVIMFVGLSFLARYAAAAGNGPVLLGTLLDVRAITGGAQDLLLDADLPLSQPVTFTLEASTDLATWQPVAQKVVYHATASDHAVPSEASTLSGVDLHGHYLRVTWSAASRLLSPVTIRSAPQAPRSAIMTTQGQPGGAGRIIVEATTPPLANPYEVRFTLPFGVPLAALRIVPLAGVAMIPVKLYGRANRKQP